jgi:hypothetical protein
MRRQEPGFPRTMGSRRDARIAWSLQPLASRNRPIVRRWTSAAGVVTETAFDGLETLLEPSRATTVYV